MERLSSLAPGDSACITGFAAPLSDKVYSGGEPMDDAALQELAATLLKVGFVPGSTLVVVARALGKDPIAVDVRGARVALGRSEAACVVVQRVGA
jgi:Fe2+ transport system protein FeoA